MPHINQTHQSSNPFLLNQINHPLNHLLLIDKNEYLTMCIHPWVTSIINWQESNYNMVTFNNENDPRAIGVDNNNVPRRIYAPRLLEDPVLEEAKQFSIESIQEEHNHIV
eukprot:308488_1